MENLYLCSYLERENGNLYIVTRNDLTQDVKVGDIITVNSSSKGMSLMTVNFVIPVKEIGKNGYQFNFSDRRQYCSYAEDREYIEYSLKDTKNHKTINSSVRLIVKPKPLHIHQVVGKNSEFLTTELFRKKFELDQQILVLKSELVDCLLLDDEDQTILKEKRNAFKTIKSELDVVKKSLEEIDRKSTFVQEDEDYVLFLTETLKNK